MSLIRSERCPYCVHGRCLDREQCRAEAVASQLRSLRETFATPEKKLDVAKQLFEQAESRQALIGLLYGDREAITTFLSEIVEEPHDWVRLIQLVFPQQ